MKLGLKAFFIHFFVFVFFVIVALAYFSPVLQGKVIEQSDIRQYTGMAKEQNDFRKKTGEEPYWTNSAFGGMPTYQLGAYYPHDYVKKLDRLIRFLPRPADYLFIYFLGFYILLCCLKVDYRLAAMGALAFGFSTYLIIILGVGHNAKAHALAYMPMLLGGIVLTFRKKYLWGFVLTAIAMALEVGANHYQMTYYFMLLVLILGLVYLFFAIRKNELRNFFTSVGLLLVAVVLGIAANATGLMATKEYADWSTRGTSELTINPDGSTKTTTKGLDKNYITQYSYGIAESLNLFVPRLFGGSNSEDLGSDSKTYDFLIDQGISRSQALDFSRHLPLYWGDQPIVAAPAYIGAVILFLFLLGLLLVKGRAKWWLLGGVVLSLLLSWGKNFGFLTDFMIDYFPFYNKFRAVSSIQVIVELCAPVLGILALKELIDPTVDNSRKLKALKISFFTMLGLGVALFLVKNTFSFEGASDETLKRYYGDEILSLIRLDREAVYSSDLLRTLVFVILAAAAIWLFLKGKLKGNMLILAMGVLIVVDLVGVDLRYVNKDDFVSKRKMAAPFPITPTDQKILQDKSIYRVYDPQEGLNGARTSFYHKSIGGYHAAKPARLQDLFDFYIYQGKIEILNMLNVKYVVQQNEEGKNAPTLNAKANGNAWFIDSLIGVNSANEEITALGSIDLKHEAVVNTTEFSNINRFDFQVDSLATVTLTDYEPNHLVYKSSNPNAGVLVFSEMFYENGWNAYIDGQRKDHFRVNYVLRALKVPEGDHTIAFKFEPPIIEKGSQISLVSSILLVLIILGGIFYSVKRSSKKEEDQ
ncbi:YfhO family protein [Maribacter sp. ANRC-HE7]|uniref:YfhO family protein n=1 Tax=Maribacter aquimaris TaxID=2737171 RepID=A0ABR7V3E2_9FLAO|nr:YfhO family protein [Maribacter aquimaris]MBD0777663.1 YfhO family protein [Maribacter aquimaris]